MLELFNDPVLASAMSKSQADEKGWNQLTIQYDTFENARQRLLNFGDKVTGIEVFVADDASVAAARRQLSQIVGMQAWVFDW